MAAKPKLTIVPDEPPLDLYATWRAEIAQRDWSRVMIEGDRRQPIALSERVVRLWR